MNVYKGLFFESGDEVLRVGGEVDASNAFVFLDEIRRQTLQGPFVLDMTGVRLIDYSGLGALVQSASCMDGAGPLRIRPSPEVYRALVATGLDTLRGIEVQASDEMGGSLVA